MTDETFPLATDAASDAATITPRPRIRWAGIVWGLVFAAIGAGLLLIATDPTRRDDVEAWWLSLSPEGFALTVALVIGALFLVGGLAAVLRRATRGH